MSAEWERETQASAPSTQHRFFKEDVRCPRTT